MKLQRHRNSSAAQVSIEHFPETLSVSMALVARTNQMHFSDASWKDGIPIRTISLKLMLMSDSVLYTIQCRAQLFLSGSLVTWGIYFLWPPIMAWSSLWRCFKRPEEIFKRTTVQMAVVAPGRFFAANKVSFWCQCSGQIFGFLCPVSSTCSETTQVNISDFERYILVQNGGSSGAGVWGSLHQGHPLVSGGPRMAITAPGVTCCTVAPVQVLYTLLLCSQW